MATTKQDKKKHTDGVEHTIKIIGPKWTVLIIKELLDGTKRFGEMERTLQGISPRTLSLRLSYMEKVGVVERRVYPEVPPRVEYKLTPAGKSLDQILKAMQQWGTAHTTKRK